MGADRVLAQPATITGSIGIYGGKYVFRDLYGKLDYNVEPIERGAHSGFFSPSRPFSEEERALLREQLEESYSLFIEKVADGRGFESPEQVDAIARGRVWTGRQALERGLVDRLGGLTAAVEEVRELAGLSPDEAVRLDSYPRPPTLTEMFFGGGAQARQELSRAVADEALAGLPAPLRELAAAGPALELLAGERVLALLPWELRIR
jgi:protease-4